MSDFEFLSTKEIKNIQDKCSKRSFYLLIFIVPSFFVCVYFLFQVYLGNKIPFYGIPLPAMIFIATLITLVLTKNTLSNHQYCNVDQAKEIISLASEYKEVTNFLLNINTLKRKPTLAEYYEILAIGRKCEHLLITKNSEDQKVFDELASLGDLASLGKLANLKEK